MPLSPKFLSTLVATLGLCLLTSCAVSTPNATVNEATPQTTSVNAESSAVDKAQPSSVEAEAASLEASVAAKQEAVPSSAEATLQTAEEPIVTAEVVPQSDAEPAAVFVENGVAIRGADPVAYFIQSSYVAGSADYTYEWGGAVWQFANAENRDLFASNPGQYAPQYGGFCAWAVSQGYTAPVDPTAWEVVDGKLYLNFDARIQRRWQQDIPGNIAQADQNWPGVVSN